jgi:hypothetical protein
LRSRRPNGSSRSARSAQRSSHSRSRSGSRTDSSARSSVSCSGTRRIPGRPATASSRSGSSPGRRPRSCACVSTIAAARLRETSACASSRCTAGTRQPLGGSAHGPSSMAGCCSHRISWPASPISWTSFRTRIESSISPQSTTGVPQRARARSSSISHSRPPDEANMLEPATWQLELLVVGDNITPRALVRHPVVRRAVATAGRLRRHDLGALPRSRPEPRDIETAGGPPR